MDEEHPVDPELLAKQFKANPTLEEYLRIRKHHPDADFDVSFVGGIDHAFALEKLLQSHGISPHLYTWSLDANDAAIRQMSLIIMEDMRAEELLKIEGETHLASRRKVMPQHLRDWLTCCMLGSFSRYDAGSLCTDLIALLQFRLMAGASRIEEIVDMREKRVRAAFVAGSLKAQGKEPSFRKVAVLLGVQPSTVKRWFLTEAEFRAEGDRLAALFEADGTLKDIFKQLGPLHRD
jgi:hypothetical protein